ncbi:MAG: hypothetical protein QW220_03215 [Candidatus Bathyarchaeia archaeon]
MPCDKNPTSPDELRTLGLRGWIIEDVWIDKYEGWKLWRRSFRKDRLCRSFAYNQAKDPCQY